MRIAGSARRPRSPSCASLAPLASLTKKIEELKPLSVSPFWPGLEQNGECSPLPALSPAPLPAASGASQPPPARLIASAERVPEGRLSEGRACAHHPQSVRRTSFTLHTSMSLPSDTDP